MVSMAISQVPRSALNVHFRSWLSQVGTHGPVPNGPLRSSLSTPKSRESKAIFILLCLQFISKHSDTCRISHSAVSGLKFQQVVDGHDDADDVVLFVQRPGDVTDDAGNNEDNPG